MAGSSRFRTGLDDTNSRVFTSGAVAVSDVAEEAKVGASANEDRQFIYIENTGNQTIYYGPSGTTSGNGARLFKDQWMVIAATKDIQVFLICESGKTSTAIVQELG